ncbi:MAG: HD domain-containing protein [Ignavibacteriales bacterium]
MISKQLLEMLFDAASMQRWNDHIRPHRGFTELDKQAHKMIFAYVIAKFEESERGASVNWQGIIEGGLFEFFHRVKLTDLKPAIFHKVMEQKSRELNEWVLKGIANSVKDVGDDFYGKFHRYLFEPEYMALEKRILKAAHYLATNWEFEIIYRLNSNLFGIEETKANIGNEIEEHFDLVGVQKIWLGKETHNFLDLIGQLRFQQRWAQSPRVPETSVLGHMLVVAVLSYLCSVEMGACSKRVYNDFYGGLFHDLPEVLTRDIISPVKDSVAGLDEIIKDIEAQQVEERIMTLVPDTWHKEIRYFIEDEFASKIMRDGEPVRCSSAEISASYNSDKFSPIDGELVRACDKLAAFIEASLSISYGIKSRHLEDGKKSSYASHGSSRIVDFNFRPLFDYFA